LAEAYTPAGTYNDQDLNPTEKSLIRGYKEMWEKGSAANDQSMMDEAHRLAETVRAGSAMHYSGGADGSDYIGSGGTAYGTPATTVRSPASGSTSAGLYGATGAGLYADVNVVAAVELPHASSAADYITDMYARQREENLQSLKNAYDANVNTLESAKAMIPAEYLTARNALSAGSEIEKQSFREYASARNLGSGTGSQASLSMDNARLIGLSGISNAEAGKLAELDLQRAQTEIKYKNDIADEISRGNFAKAQQLYNDFVRVDASIVATAYNQARL
jgi:hypothetical protein